MNINYAKLTLQLVQYIVSGLTKYRVGRTNTAGPRRPLARLL